MLSGRCDPVLEVGPGVTGLRAVRESPAGSGPLAALVAGSNALATDGTVESVVLLACDVPGVAAVLDALVTVASPVLGALIPVDEHGRRQYVCARYGPIALARSAALVVTGERSLRAMVDSLPEEVVAQIDGFASGTFADIDVPDDARRAGIKIQG